MGKEYLLKCFLCNQEKDAWENEFRDVVLDGRFRSICKECFDLTYFKCSQCDEDHKVEVRIMHDGKAYCKTCFDATYIICAECGDVVRKSDARRTNGDKYLCQECYRQGEILSNGYKPEPKFKKVTGEDHVRYMGVELEIDSSERCDTHNLSKEICKLANKDSYNKHDGSLHNGFEIVTHPMSLKYHEEKYPWDKIMETAVSKGFKSHKTKTCGLHVHLNRRAFGENETKRDFNIMKMVIFFENNWDKLVNFSRRNPEALNSWARRFNIYPNVTKQADWEHHFKNCKNDGNRYHAVNLTNSSTIEIRIFRGTLVKQTMFAALELLDLLMQKLPEMSFEDTIKYDFKSILKDASELSYSNLISYCKERSIPEDSKKADITVPVIGNIVEITGRIPGFPERSGRSIGLRGKVIRIDERSLGFLVRFDFGEYICPATSIRVIDLSTEVEETEERKSV